MSDRAIWLKTLPLAVAAAADEPISCPTCGQKRLEFRYIGDPSTRIGYVLLWCNACLHGISVSRVRAPESVVMGGFDDPHALAGVPQFLCYE